MNATIQELLGDEIYLVDLAQYLGNNCYYRRKKPT